MIVIVDYGMGNVGSVQNMLWRLGHESKLGTRPEDVAAADKLILPGVGAFDSAMDELRARGLDEALDRRVRRAGVPLLGICLGMQLLGIDSEEGRSLGLGWIGAHTRRFRFDGFDKPLPIPHMGWRDVQVSREHPITNGLPPASRFYFVHSYHVVCDDPAITLLSAEYGARFCAALARDNIVATQFHPEKSHRFGLSLLDAFAGWRP